MATNQINLFDLIGEANLAYSSFCKLNDGQPHLMLSLLGYNLVFFQGRVYPHKQGAGPFIPSESLSGHRSVLESFAEVFDSLSQDCLPDIEIYGYAVSKTEKGYQAVSALGQMDAETFPALMEKLKTQNGGDFYRSFRKTESLKLFDLIGEPTRQYAYWRKQNNADPQLLMSLMGFNLVFSKGRVYLQKQGDGAFVSGGGHPGYFSVLEACAEVLEQAGGNSFPDILAFGYVIRRSDKGVWGLSGANTLESESLVGLVMELKKRRDENLKIYIHVGMPKTATTFLQRQVFPKLHGVHYVEWTTEFFAHELRRMKYGCPFCYIEEIRHGFDRYLESFDEDKVLISEEAFTGSSFRAKAVGSSVIVLKEVFPQASILLVLREQLSYLRSFYLHKLRDGLNRSAVNFVRYDKTRGEFINFDLDILNNNIDMKYFEYMSLVNLFRSNFQSVHILLYEQLKYSPSTFTSGLSNWLGKLINIEDVIKTKENAGLGLLGVIILKVFNCITAGREWIWHEPRIAGFIDWVNRLDAKFHIPYEPFPHWLQLAIRQRYEEKNKELSRMIGVNVELYWGLAVEERNKIPRTGGKLSWMFGVFSKVKRL